MSNLMTTSKRDGVRFHFSIRTGFRYTVCVWLSGVFTTPAAYVVIVNHWL
jgi:hypothetical protein